MESKPDGRYKYIGHVVDHFSKFHIAFAMKTKGAHETAKKVAKYVFAFFGLPSIIHSDNGTEFVNDVISSLVAMWPGTAKFVNGNPGNSKCQGLVEQGNNTIQTMIAALEYEKKELKWASWLPEIMRKSIIVFI